MMTANDAPDSREFYINDDGIRLHAKLDFPEEKAEKYPLVIIIHGFTGHMEEPHIVAVARALNEIGYATLRAEMYGHGKSDGQFKDHTLYKWISNALAVIDYARGLDFVTDLYLCGHSQGGLLVMLAGAMERDHIKALIPMSAGWMIPEYARSGELLGQYFDPEQIPDEIDSWEDLRLGGNYIRVAQMIDVLPAIEKYTGPVLLIHGDEDEAVPVRYSYEAAEKYADAQLVIIPGDDHCYEHHLELVTQAVQDFMKKFH